MSSDIDLPGNDASRFVPLLTEVVSAQELAQAGYQVGNLPQRLTTAAEVPEQRVQSILQALDLHLEGRLREAVGRVVLAQAQNLLPELRAEIELAVRQAVQQAVASTQPTKPSQT
jgi:hypothetical protein